MFQCWMVHLPQLGWICLCDFPLDCSVMGSQCCLEEDASVSFATFNVSHVSLHSLTLINNMTLVYS